LRRPFSVPPPSLLRPRSVRADRREERLIVCAAEDRAPNCRQNVIGVVVADIERQITIDPLECAGTVERAGAARANGALDCVFGEHFDQESRSDASRLGGVVLAAIPETRDAL